MHDIDYKKLSNEKLLGLIVSKNSAIELLERFGNLEEVLIHAHPIELARINGIGEKQVQRLKAVLELSYRLYESPLSTGAPMLKPTDVYSLHRDMQHLKQEHMLVLCLNTKNVVIASKTIAIGTLDSASVTPRELYQLAVRVMSKSIIVIHNHPSGDPTPSKDDLSLTARIKEAGECLGILLLDHIIIGNGRFRSLKEMGTI